MKIFHLKRFPGPQGQQSLLFTGRTWEHTILRAYKIKSALFPMFKKGQWSLKGRKATCSKIRAEKLHDSLGVVRSQLC